VVLEKLKGGRPQTNTGVIKYVYFTIKVDKDNRNRTGLVERCLRKRPRSDLAPSSCGSPSYKGRGWFALCRKHIPPAVLLLANRVA
jgi:hypothetical protein